ncbi:hypothetical protein [Nocardioides sp. 616]|uniref:hypothetical protein n=1 Tax=Nocardioides sp. 616 TaxID=2268090 RepID=UPI000CE41FEC|nr:hypothetical protein [Nocardioides sp. 616]
MDVVPALSAVARETFRLGSRARSARFFHPRGEVLAGHLEIQGAGPLPTGRTECVVRMSKAIGLPARLPDILGIAFRYPDASGAVDVLLATSPGTRGWRRWALWPAASWGRATFTSLLPWESVDRTRVLVLAELADHRLTGVEVDQLASRLPVRIRLRVASAAAELQRGELVVTGPRQPTPDFDPVLNEPPGWHFVPAWLARVRRSSYAGSRAGRPDTGGREPDAPRGDARPPPSDRGTRTA